MSTQRERTATWLACKRLPGPLALRIASTVEYDSLGYTLTFWGPGRGSLIEVQVAERDWLTDETIARICLEVP